MARFDTGRLIALLVGGLLANSGPAFAQAMPTPSFDCTTADHYVEWGICHDADLARLDAAIGERYQALLTGLDPVAAQTLRADQERFLADRNSFIGGTLRGEWVDAMKEDIAAKLEARLEELEAIKLDPQAGPSSYWRTIRGRQAMLPARSQP